MKVSESKFLVRNISLIAGTILFALPAMAAEPVAAADAPPETPAQGGAEVDFFSREGLTGDWWGVRKDLEDRGLSLEASFTTEISKNLKGGINTERFTAEYLFNLSLTLNLEKMVGLPGAEVFANFQQFGGASPSTDAGDVQGVSSIDGGDRTQLSEIWYKQSLLPGSEFMWIKVGKIDANSDFAYLESSGEFINGAMALPISDGLLPTYPDGAFGAEIFITPVEWFYAAGGIFDGSLAEGMRTGLNGPKSLFASPADLYLIGELGGKWDINGYVGTVKTGVRYNTGTFERYDGGLQDGSWGGYVLAEQLVCRLNPEDKESTRGVWIFGGFDWADDQLADNPFGTHYSFGLSLSGPFDFRPDDAVGVGFTSGRFSRATNSGFNHESEQTIEAFYKAQITPWLSVKPDLQYIVNPGGAPGVSEALVATVRIEVLF